MYHHCPHQYEERYIKGKTSPPGVPLVTGSAGHRGVEVDLQHMIDHEGALAPEEMVTEAAAKTFTEKAQEVDSWGSVDPGKEKDRVIKMVKAHHQYQTPKFNPVGVEEKIEVSIDGIPVLGYLDLRETDRIVDHKFVKRHKSQRDADSDIQLSFYSLATGINKVAFNSVKKQSSPSNKDIKLLESTRTDRDYQWLVELIGHTAEAISKGVFPVCKPDEWWCDQRFCGYWNQCRGRDYHKPQIDLIAVDIPTERGQSPANGRPVNSSISLPTPRPSQPEYPSPTTKTRTDDEELLLIETL